MPIHQGLGSEIVEHGSELTEAGWRVVAPGSSFVTWAASAPEEVHFPGSARPMPDRVDYRFRNGWVDTGDLPCREALRAALPGRRVDCPEGPFDRLVMAEDGVELDFSVFRFRPTLIRRGFRCRARSTGAGPVRLGIATCGGVRLWVDGAPAAVFEPFERNRPSRTEAVVTLPREAAALTLLLEDLHERDTTNFFALTLLDGPAVEVALPPGLSAEAAARAAEMLAGVRIDGVFHEGGAVRLLADPAPGAEWSLRRRGPAMFPRGGISAEPGAEGEGVVTLGPGRTGAALFDVAEAPNGCVTVEVSTEAGGATLTRHLGTTVVKRGVALGATLEERKARAAGEIAGHAGFEPSVAALLALRGARPERVEAIVAATLASVEERLDCSDFGILPLLRL